MAEVRDEVAPGIVVVEAPDIMARLGHQSPVVRRLRGDDFRGDEDDQFTLFVLEPGGPEQGPEDGDVTQPGQLVDGVGAGGVDQSGQDNGLNWPRLTVFNE